MNDKRLILFDYDGVIVDSLQHNVVIARECCEQLGFDFFPSLDEVRNMDNMTFGALGSLMGISEEKTEALTSCIFGLLTARVDVLTVFPGIESLLKKLYRDHILAIVTTNIEEGVSSFLGKKGLSEYFSDVSGGDRPGSKADKTGELMKRFSIQKERVYLIGDTTSDISEARAAGVNSIAATWGFQDKKRLLSGHPDFVVESPGEIEDLFERLVQK